MSWVGGLESPVVFRKGGSYDIPNATTKASHEVAMMMRVFREIRSDRVDPSFTLETIGLPITGRVDNFGDRGG